MLPALINAFRAFMMLMISEKLGLGQIYLNE
jgi:hypothetical protein